jgi:cytochrome c2
MPATEQTWRNLKLMHVVFGITGLALLGATIWMFAADHDREWKDYQRTFQNVEAWTTQARLDAQKTGEYETKRSELVEAVNAATAAAPQADLVDDFQQRIETNEQGDTSDIEELQKRATDQPSEANRTALLDEMQQFVTDARFEEDDLSRRLKFRRADMDVARSDKDLAVGDGKSASEVAPLQAEVERLQAEVDELAAQFQDASTYRKELESILIDIRREESDAREALADHDANVKQLADTRAKQDRPSKKLLEMPILDAFNSPLKVNQIWLPKLTLNNNFRDVARFDRCTTCHLGIEATAPGSAVEPGYKPSQQLTLQLATPAEPPQPAKNQDGETEPVTTRQVYGLQLADEGLFSADDVTIEVVEQRTAAANAQLIPGDVIESIGGVRIPGRERALDYLLKSVKWGQPLALGIRRGLPHPFSSHPRLDLYVGSLSPHKANDVGCTICHEGQGSATSFKWASHTPNSPAEAERWARKYGWFDNHHWIFPMRPERFLESSCLKCHHEVTELNPSERYPEPPAPKLVKGYNLVRQYGCFGCHEINGYDGPDKRIGPDLRAEPNYAFAAQHLLADQGLEPREKDLAQQVIDDPTNDTARRQLVQLIEADSRRAAGDEEGDSHLNADSHSLAAVLADVETPGEYRKVGPSLRYLASKVDYNFLYDWIRNPRDFRPSTKMPRFFGLHDHLVPEAKLEDGQPVLDDHGHVVKEESKGKKEADKFEPIEIRAITEYLLASSQPFEYLETAESVTEKPSAERGKQLFQLRGCLACHQHADFPEAKQTQGPDLSRLGSKLTTEEGRKWLYSWVREPNRYHTRTVMPNVFLEPIEAKDKDGNVTSVTDPAADMTEYLLASQGWQAKDIPNRQQLSDGEETALAELAMSHLTQAFTRKRAEKYLVEGIPESERANLKGDEVLLIGELTDDNRIDRVLQYVGRRSISKYGCSGCHDIPGFENAKPIGTALADWGRKDPAKLAFEQIGQYIAEAHGGSEHGGHGHGPNVRDLPPDEGYMMEKLLHHQREGFLWQKLREPRSYDYKKTENKSYNEQLRMPQFPLNAEEIEAVMTFVLGLVAEPPAAQYVYNPDPRQKAIVEGKHLLDKFNCAGCHTLEMEKYRFEFDPNHGLFANERSYPNNEYELFRPHFTPKQIKDSMRLDARGRGHAEITASVVTDEQGEVQEQEDDENPDLVLNFFTLWNTTLINGQPWLAAEQVPIPTQWITGKREPVGGDLARLLHPVVLEAQREVNPNAKASDAWGWVPPPLVGQGQKVQTDWMHDFLLDPYAIRPATVLRMPKFNMSSEEASRLANYFAAVDGVDYPYDFESRTRESHLTSMEQKFPNRFKDAMSIVTNGNFCVKCHKVGDFAPQGSEKDLAPQLGQIYRRLRPEYLEAWLANPKRLLPYTGMPVNFPVDKALDPEVIKGDKGKLITEGESREHLEAVVDLLLNYDEFTKNHFSVKPLVQAAPMPGAEGQPTSSGE